ncbi:MAG: UbiA family prenyltransferase [Firmicutes bacterium]|nr:UbiA family prenyltransferase [Bacillota bacterium]
MRKVKLFLKMIDFHESIFALPFAYISALLATGGQMTWSQAAWLLVAMVSGRSLAMAFNRMIDVEFDARNPRTADHIMPKGLLSKKEVTGAIILCAIIFVIAAAQFNLLTLMLSPVAIFIMTFYSFTKRFTWATHLILGVALGQVPIAAWLALTGGVEMPAWLLGAAVACWVAGFDIIFALQDMEADAKEGLYSIPVRFGLEKSLWWSRGLHLLALVFFALTGYAVGADFFYWIGFALVAILLAVEQGAMATLDLSRLNFAYFKVNGFISIAFFVFTWLSLVF